METVLQDTEKVQIQDEVAQLIALQESDNTPKERINLTGNEGINTNIYNSDPINDDDGDQISLQIKAEDIQAFRTPNHVPEHIDIDQVETTPVQRNLQHMENMEAAFEKGYDTEDEIGPFWGATCLEGPQDPEEEPLGTLNWGSLNLIDINMFWFVVGGTKGL